MYAPGTRAGLAAVCCFLAVRPARMAVAEMRITEVTRTADDFRLSVGASNGTWFVLQRCSDLTGGEWENLQTDLVSESHQLDIAMPMATLRSPAFFRTRLPIAASTEETNRYAQAADFSQSVEGDSLLVMKDGRVVFERYEAGQTPATPHMLASGTKSFGAALFSLGETETFWTLDERVADTVVEWQSDTNKSNIRIRHLLSLTSGLLDSTNYSATDARNLDTYDLAINESTSLYPPGFACIYAPCNFQILAVLFERKTGQDPVAYLYDHLLEPLGFSSNNAALWTRDVLGKPQMAGGAYFTAREWANYGKLWLQRGAWQGVQMLDPEAIRLSTTCTNTAFLGYGLTWWLNRPTQGTYEPAVDSIPADPRGDGDQIASNAPADMYMAAGTGKQRLYVIPSLDLVVVRFGMALGNPLWSDHELLGTILGTP